MVRAEELIETQPSRFVRHTRRCEAEFPVPTSDAGACVPHTRTGTLVGDRKRSIRPSDNVLSSLQGSDRCVLLKYIDALTNQIGWDPNYTTTDTISLPDDEHAVPPDTTSILRVRFIFMSCCPSSTPPCPTLATIGFRLCLPRFRASACVS